MTQDWQNFPQDDLDAARRFATDFYHALKPTPCPALGGDLVAYTNKGMSHILFKRARTEEEILERLRCLEFVEQILCDPGADVEYRVVQEREYVKKRGVFVLCEIITQYWTLTGHITGFGLVKVVVRQVGNGGKYFFSIMKRRSNKQKTP